MAPGTNGRYYNEFRENNVNGRGRNREPGELLSSDSGSDEALNVEVNGVNENVIKTHEVSAKKRKFSPVVWDRDDKEVSNVSKSRFSVSGDVVQMSVLENDEFQKTETAVDIGSRESNGFEHRVEMSSSLVIEENIVNVTNGEKLEDEDNVPSRCIRSSRWANDADSPVDEDEVSDALGKIGRALTQNQQNQIQEEP